MIFPSILAITNNYIWVRLDGNQKNILLQMLVSMIITSLLIDFDHLSKIKLLIVKKASL